MTAPDERFHNVIALVEQADKYAAQMTDMQEPHERDLARSLYFGALSELHDELHHLAKDGVLPVLQSFLETWALTR